MKKVVLFVLALVVLMPMALTSSPVSAQASGTCSEEQLTQWWIAIIGLVDRYGQTIQETSSLPSIATIQAIRREYDAVEPPACELSPAPDLVADMFNLRTDSMILLMLGDPQAATLSEQSDAAYQQVLQEMGDVTPPTPTATGPVDGVVTAITSPTDGATVPMQTNVQGTVNLNDLAGGSLWLFIFASDGKYYPQVGDACTNPTTIHIPEGRTRWTVTAYIGGDADAGSYFELRLGTLSEENTQTFLGQMQQWCNNGFAGFTEAQIYDELGFNEISFVGVTRQ
jgi:hypothetical protein